MIRHLLKLVWNRKRANALIIAEIFVSFLVLFGVLAAVAHFGMNWRRPLGYDWHDVWRVDAGIEVDAHPENDPRVHQTMMRLLQEASTLPGVVAVAADNTPPYVFSTEAGGTKVKGQYVDLIFDNATDGFAAVMRLHLIRGRWFGKEDDAAQRRPAVINARAAKALFGDADPIGQKISFESPEDDLQVVGVIDEFRKDGEPSTPVNAVFRRVAPDHKFGGLTRDILVRVEPGTPASFEETLTRRLQAVAPDMSFRTYRLDRMRADAFRFRLAPIVLGGVVALFLVSMVALGLTGVLWQNVTRRTREIGLRRAVGATGSRVHRQILGEVLVLATIACLIGLIVVLQLPLVGVFRFLSREAYAGGCAGALVLIYALTLLCGIYPSVLAARLQPADALRHD